MEGTKPIVRCNAEYLYPLVSVRVSALFCVYLYSIRLMTATWNIAVRLPTSESNYALVRLSLDSIAKNPVYDDLAPSSPLA